jgi:proteic killer suppression protein
LLDNPGVALFIPDMIRSFRPKALRQFAQTGDATMLSVPNIDRVRRILRALNEAIEPDQIPGYKFHLLIGRDKGRYSVWVSGNWRITFSWEEKDATDVDLEDYH